MYSRTAQIAPAEKYLAIARERYGGEWAVLWMDARLAWLRGDRTRARELLAEARRVGGADFEEEHAGEWLTTSVALE